MTARRGRVLLGRALRVVFGLLGVAFLVVAFVRTWDGSVGQVTVAWWRVAVAGSLALIGLGCAFRGWAVLVGGDERRALAWGFYVSQLGKYIPGGVWQAVGQVGYTTRANVSVGRATAAFAVFAVTQAAAGGLVGSAVAAFGTGLAPALRIGALAALGLAVFLHRRWMIHVLNLARRFRKSLDAEALVPSQRAIVHAAAWSVGTMVVFGGAFAVLLDGLESTASLPLMLSASALAWTVGFLVLPVPSGIGVREAVLIALLGGTAATPTLIVASVYHRLVIMTGEALMIVGARWALRRGSAAPEPTAGGDQAKRD